MANLLILGGNSNLASVFKTIYPKEVIVLDKKKCDITNKKQLENIVKKTSCKFIINCAAVTDMNYCQENPLICLNTNAIAVNHLNLLCNKYKKKLIHFSSDYALNPINLYGLSKSLSEGFVSKNNLVIRTNFYSEKAFIPKTLMNKDKASYYENVYSNPISIIKVVSETYKNRNKRGLINIFSNECVSYYKFALLYAEVFGIKKHIGKSRYKAEESLLALKSCIKTDINVDIKKDLKEYKKFLEDEN